MGTIQETSAQVSLKDTIVKAVELHPGIKGVELVLNVMSMVGPNMFDDREYMLELSRALDSGEIIEIEYCLASMDYRIKSLYFPKGTKVNAPQTTQCDDGSVTVLPRI